LHLREMQSRAPLAPLLAKELREIAAGRAFWTMLLLLCPLVGFSFVQAVDLYAAASASAMQSPAAASSLSPLDGVLVPTFGSFYVGVTLLFPFVAIRVLGHEKESGALRLLVQLPYHPATLAASKLAAVQCAWALAAVPALSAAAFWLAAGGHLHAGETANLVLGHLLYGLLIGAIALFAASISDSAATAAIMTLAVTIGSWVLDFAAAGQSGVLGALARVSLTQMLRPFEQGLLSPSLVTAMISASIGFAGLTAIWLPSGVPVRSKLLRSGVVIPVLIAGFGLTVSVQRVYDVTEDQRNSFPSADQRVLATLTAPLVVTVHLAPEDPRYVDLRRNVLARLERVMPNVAIHLAGERYDANADSYGEINYAYGDRSDTSRSTSPREVLPLLYGLAGVAPPRPADAPDYPGFPLVANSQPAMIWFFGVLPLLIAACWWWSRRPAALAYLTKERRHE
jgi:ABC-2 type transport system permease protein